MWVCMMSILPLSKIPALSFLDRLRGLDADKGDADRIRRTGTAVQALLDLLWRP